MDPQTSTTFSFTKSPLLSKTLIGIGISLLPFLQKKFGLELGDADVQEIVENLLTVAGAALAIYGRFTARTRLSSAAPIVSALLAACLLQGCAGSAADLNFRRRVDSVEVKTGADYDPMTHGASGTIDATIHYRDPDAKRVKPLGALHRVHEGEVFEEDGWSTDPRRLLRATPPRFRAPSDVPASWLRTLYYFDGEKTRVITPIFATAEVPRVELRPRP